MTHIFCHIISLAITRNFWTHIALLIIMIMDLYSVWERTDGRTNDQRDSEFAICHIVRHGNAIVLHCWISYSRGILNRIHVAVVYKVTNRKLTSDL